MSSIWTNGGRLRVANQSLNLVTNGNVKAMLLDTGYTPDKDHEYVSSIVANELGGTGYVGGFGGSGRKALAGKSIAKNDTTDLVVFDCNDLSWTAIDAGTVGYVAIIEEDTNDASSPVIAIVDASPDVPTNGGDYTLQVHATNGLLTISSP